MKREGKREREREREEGGGREKERSFAHIKYNSISKL